MLCSFFRLAAFFLYYECQDNPTFLLLLDVVPACVIVLSAAIAGLSADIEPEHMVWKALHVLVNRVMAETI